MVTLVIDNVAVRGIKNFNFTKTAAGVITSCVSCDIITTMVTVVITDVYTGQSLFIFWITTG